MKPFERLDAWHKTRFGLLIFGLVELAAAYGFVSWSIDSGNLFDWLFAILFFVGGVQNLIKLITKVARHEDK